MSRALSLVSLLMLSACGAPTLGNFDSMGFVHERYPYTVDYRDAAKQELINSDWQLDNFYVKQGKLTPKSGPDYELVTHFDLDGDGRYEHKQKGYAYDLKLEHASREQTIWLRTIPIDAGDARKNLDVLMRDYVAAVAGSGYAIVSLTGKSLTISERRFATEMIGQKQVVVADREALLVLFDVANVDQLSVNQQDRTKRVALLFVRSKFKHEIARNGTQGASEFPVIMVAGYASHPADFEKGLGAFEYFVTRIKLCSSHTRGIATDEEVRAAPALAIDLPAGSVAALAQSAAPAPAVTPEAAPAPAATPTPASAETPAPAATPAPATPAPATPAPATPPAS